MPFDLSDSSGSNQEVSRPDAGTTPATGRASDLLTGGGSKQPSKKPLPGEGPSFLSARPVTPADDVVNAIMYVALVLSVICIVYLLYNVWSGTIGDPNFTQKYTHDARLQVLNNINNVDNVVVCTAWVSAITAAFLYYDVPYVGYVMILVFALFNIGVPSLSSYFLTLSKSTHTVATDTAIRFLVDKSYIPAVLGTPLILLDLVRRMVDAAAVQRSKRSTFKYGKGAIKTIEKRNVFLGPCWNMPYCRQITRKRCPVHAKGQGPCWRKKAGCMCEESVSVIATTPGNWKAAVANAVGDADVLEVAKPSGTNPLLNFSPSGGRSTLTNKEKAARCRDCVIYNAHQEQKYRAMVGVVMVATASVLVFWNAPLIDGVSRVYNGLNSAFAHFSLGSTGDVAAAASGDISSPVAWFILIVFGILFLSKMLQLVEYLCFTLKV